MVRSPYVGVLIGDERVKRAIEMDTEMSVVRHASHVTAPQYEALGSNRAADLSLAERVTRQLQYSSA